MVTPTNPQTLIDSNTDPALSRTYPATFQDFPPLTGNTAVYITNVTNTQIVTELATDQAAGANGQLQFNTNNKLAADSGLSYDPGSDSLTVSGAVRSNVIYTDNLLRGNGVPYSFTGNGTVGGANTTLQYNNAGNFGGITGTSYAAGNLTLGALANIKITGGVTGQTVVTDGTGNLAFANPLTIIADEFHVATNGDNATADGTIGKPYQTITAALAEVASSGKVVVHPGVYVENVVINTNNISLVAAQSDQGASPLINGNLTVANAVSAIKIQGISANTLTIATSGTVYAYQIKVSNAFSKTGNSYTEITDSDLQVSGGNVAFSGGNNTNTSTTVLTNTKVANVRITNQYSTVYIKDSIYAANIYIDGGILTADGSFLYAATNGANAITTGAGGIVSLISTSVFNPNLTAARVNLSNTFYAISSAVYDRANSTFGTSLGTSTDFQDVTAEDITVSNVTAGQNILATGNITAIGNIAGAQIAASGNLSTAANLSVTNNVTVSGAAVIAGNLTSANVNTGIITATGNISGANITLSGLALVTGNLTAGNVGTGTINASGNVSAANINATGVANIAGNISGLNLSLAAAATITGTATAGNLSTAGTLAVTGNAATANLTVTGTAAVSGNVTVGNISAGSAQLSGSANVAGFVAVTGNVSAANLNLAGIIAATGNISGANISAAGAVTATGNVSGANLTTAGVVNAGGNVTVGGLLSVTGNANVTGSTIAANITSNTFITATGNITGGNLITAGLLSVTGNIAGGNISTAGLLTVTGNITGGNISTAGVLTVTGNASAGNLTTTGILTATGNISGGNVTTAGNVVASGNVTGANLITTGTAFLTTANVTNFNLSGVTRTVNTTGVIGNVITITISGITYQLMAL